MRTVGEMAASAVNVNVRVQPFTAAQLRELERQTLIYKYLMSSVPVPHELLFPITKNPSIVSPSQPSCNLSFFLSFFIDFVNLL